MAFQHTLQNRVTLCGVGLHGGGPARAVLRPAPPGTGIRFRRSDLPGSAEIPAHGAFVVDTALATVLGRGDVTVSTVEHCLAALAGIGVDNVVVEVEGPELPIGDGSSLPFCQAILAVGLRRQEARRRAIRIVEPVVARDGDKYCALRPGEGFRVTYAVDFEGRFPGAQHLDLAVDPAVFCRELAPARTFGFLEEVTYLRSVGKARGGSLENALVLDNGRVLNPEGLRMPDELVRHKALDAVGDLALAGAPIVGHLVVHKGGHSLHTQLVRNLLARPEAWTAVDLAPDTTPPPSEQEGPLPLAAALA